MTARSRSPRRHWGVRVRGTCYAIDLIVEEGEESSGEAGALLRDAGCAAPPGPPAAGTAAANSGNSGPMVEIKELWRRVRSLEDTIGSIADDIGALYEFAEIAQRRFRVVRHRHHQRRGLPPNISSSLACETPPQHHTQARIHAK